MEYKTYAIKPMKIKFHNEKIDIMNDELLIYEYITTKKGINYHHNFLRAIKFDDVIEKSLVKNEIEFLNDDKNICYLKERVDEEKKLLIKKNYKKWFCCKILLFDNKQIAKYVKLLQMKDLEQQITKQQSVLQNELSVYNDIYTEILPYLI